VWRGARHEAYPSALALEEEEEERDVIKDLKRHGRLNVVSGNDDNEGLIGREREDLRFGFRRAAIFRTTKSTWDSLSPPSARSSGTIQIASPSPFQDHGNRKREVVIVH
jgi:hypothetical protein